MTSSADKSVRLEQMLPLVREQLAAGHLVRLMPRGTSMLPLIRQGKDAVLLAPLPQTPLKKHDIPLYRRDNGQFVLHRILKAGQTYTCCGDNQFDLETGIRPDQLIAVVTAFERNGRHFPATHPLYRLYCLYWNASRPVRHLLRRIIWKMHHLKRSN